MRAPVTIPSEELVRDACTKFDQENLVIEEALKELFGQYPRNDEPAHVLLKVVAVNSLYSTRIFAFSERVPNVMDVAEHIQRIEGVDAALVAGLPGIVDRIARVVVPGKKDRNYFSFATKYCSWHRPESYPIWDANVEFYLGRLQEQVPFENGFDVKAEHWTYPEFHGAMTAFRERYLLASFTFKEIDKFLWLHGGMEASSRRR